MTFPLVLSLSQYLINKQCTPIKQRTSYLIQTHYIFYACHIQPGKAERQWQCPFFRTSIFQIPPQEIDSCIASTDFSPLVSTPELEKEGQESKMSLPCWAVLTSLPVWFVGVASPPVQCSKLAWKRETWSAGLLQCARDLTLLSLFFYVCS